MRALPRRVTLLAAAWAGLLSAGAAQTQRDLFDQIIPPDLVLSHADAIGLDAEQRRAVRRIQAELQPRMPPLHRQMREQLEALVALLRQEKPDEAAVLARFGQLTATETELKRVRLQMTVGVKRILSAEQQAKALAVQGARPAGSGASRGPDALSVKLRRVKEGLEQWKREGRDVTPLRELWDRFREAEDKGHYRKAREALDAAVALLDAPPSPR
jgi:hypothetical protein